MRAAAAADDIFGALSASLSSTDGAARDAASAQLLRWERSAAPGFAAGLVDIASRAVRARTRRANARHATRKRALVRAQHAPSTRRRICAARAAIPAAMCTCAGMRLRALTWRCAWSLLFLTTQNEAPEAARLLAVVTLKNAVGASWRKTLASRGACLAATSAAQKTLRIGRSAFWPFLAPH